MLSIAAANPGGDSDRERREFEISSDPSFCTAHLVNDGVTVNGEETVIEFAGNAPAKAFFCALDRSTTFHCKNAALI